MSAIGGKADIGGICALRTVYLNQSVNLGVRDGPLHLGAGSSANDLHLMAAMTRAEGDGV